MKNDKDGGKKKKIKTIQFHRTFPSNLTLLLICPSPTEKKEPAESSLFLKVLFSDHLLIWRF